MPATRVQRPRVCRKFPKVPARTPLQVDRSINSRALGVVGIIICTALIAFGITFSWGALQLLLDWNPVPSSDTWDDIGFLAGLGGLAVTLFVATQIDSVTHWATSPDRVADRVILEAITAATLLATAVGAWIILWQGIIANKMSLAPAALLAWIIMVFSTLPLVARPSPTASRRSLEKNDYDYRRLDFLRTRLQAQPPTSLTKKGAWLRIGLLGAAVGSATGVALSVVPLLLIDEASPGLLLLVPGLGLYLAFLAMALAYVLCGISVRQFTNGSLSRVGYIVLAAFVGMAAITSILEVLGSTSGKAGVLTTVTAAAIWIEPILLHALVISRGTPYYVLRLAETTTALDGLKGSRRHLVTAQAQQRRLSTGTVGRRGRYRSGGRSPASARKRQRLTATTRTSTLQRP